MSARQAAPVLRQQLDEAWAQAVRPGAASPGAAVPALWFADEAELLVFLARRAAAGDTAAWWFHKTRSDLGGDVQRALREFPVIPEHCFAFAEGRWILHHTPAVVR